MKRGEVWLCTLDPCTARRSPLIDRLVETFVNFRLNGNHAQPVTNPDQRQKVALRMRGSAVFEVRAALDKAVD